MSRTNPEVGVKKKARQRDNRKAMNGQESPCAASCWLCGPKKKTAKPSDDFEIPCARLGTFSQVPQCAHSDEREGYRIYIIYISTSRLDALTS